jgi:hypothetical protein
MTRAAIIVLLCALVVMPSGARQDPVLLSVFEILDLYDLGDPAAIKLIATSRPIASIADEISKRGSAWVLQNGRPEAKRRRVVIATFALESARHSLKSGDWDSAKILFEWSSIQLFSDGTPHPAERLWREALLAFLSPFVALSDVKAMAKKSTPLAIFEEQLGFAERRFPGDPRWRMARAWLAELFALGEHSRHPPLDAAAVVPADAARLYEACLKTPELVAEARLHLAFIRLVEGQAEPALAQLQYVDAATTDGDLRSLGHLFRGWAMSRLGRSSDAIAAYQLAYDAQPEGQTAALFLATELFLSGRRSDAVAVNNRTLAGNNGDDDPWRMFYQGEYRRLAPLLIQLREAIR